MNSTLKAVAVVLALLAAPVSAQTFPAFQGHPVIDEADMIPADREAAMNAKIVAFEDRTKNEVAVVTVKSLEGYDIESYANKMFRHYGIGRADVDNGVLLLVAPNDRKVRIETGYGMESFFTDLESGRIIRDTILPEFKAGNMLAGVEKGTDAVLKAATPPTAEELALAAKMEQERKVRSAIFWAKVWDFILTLVGIVAAAASALGLYWLATIPKRRRAREAEEARVAAERAARAERERLAAIERERLAAEQRERDRLAAIEEAKRERAREAARLKREEEARRAREAMLAAMTPADRKAFLDKEEADRKEAARLAEEARQRAAAERKERERLAAIEAAEEAKRAAERRRKREQEEEEARARRRREDSYSSSSSWGSSSSSSWDSGSSFGGGDSGGGGASGSW